jgi:hypothetical protein
MSSSVAVFDDGLAHHDWPRPPRNGDSRAFYPDQAVPAHFDAAQSWSQMPASQLTSFDGPASTPFSAYHPASSQTVSSTSAPDYHQSRPPQVPVHQYQQGAYASHDHRQQATPTSYLPPSDHQAQSPIDTSSTNPQYRYSYDASRTSYPNNDYSTSSGNIIYGSTSSAIQPTPAPGTIAPGSTTTTTATYEQPHNGTSGGGQSGGDPNYGYVQSNANSLVYSEPVAPQPQRPRADFTQVSNAC